VESREQVDYLFELGRFHLEVGQWERAKQALRRILAGPVRFPKALYYLGVIAFQERNLYDARVCFSRLIATCSRDEFEKDLDNPVDMAQHYLKLLDKREFKRSHFHLVSG
jgi:tetratricopeptide (TPR) repeat protein